MSEDIILNDLLLTCKSVKMTESDEVVEENDGEFVHIMKTDYDLSQCSSPSTEAFIKRTRLEQAELTQSGSFKTSSEVGITRLQVPIVKRNVLKTDDPLLSRELKLKIYRAHINRLDQQLTNLADAAAKGGGYTPAMTQIKGTLEEERRQAIIKLTS